MFVVKLRRTVLHARWSPTTFAHHIRARLDLSVDWTSRRKFSPRNPDVIPCSLLFGVVGKRRYTSHNHEQFMNWNKIQDTLPSVFLDVLKGSVESSPATLQQRAQSAGAVRGI